MSVSVLTVASTLVLAVMAGCTITPPDRPLVITPAGAVNSATLDQYRSAVARRIIERSPSYVLHGTPQAMLRSLVVVSFTVDRNGQVLQSSVYRTNGDDEAESTALATLRRASPLPQPPGALLNGRGQLELFEDWLFNDNGKFQLRESPRRKRKPSSKRSADAAKAAGRETGLTLPCSVVRPLAIIF